MFCSFEPRRGARGGCGVRGGVARRRRRERESRKTPRAGKRRLPPRDWWGTRRSQRARRSRERDGESTRRALAKVAAKWERKRRGMEIKYCAAPRKILINFTKPLDEAPPRATKAQGLHLIDRPSMPEQASGEG